MRITIRYFASLREQLGTASEVVELPAGIATAGALRSWLAARGAPFDRALAPGRAVRAAVAQVMAKPDTPLADGVEVAFFPPVTGG
ncbi:MAG: molybdopterin converting factor subunit 1 [Lautropia sp.]